jgi:hypothetical protein
MAKKRSKEMDYNINVGDEKIIETVNIVEIPVSVSLDIDVDIDFKIIYEEYNDEKTFKHIKYIIDTDDKETCFDDVSDFYDKICMVLENYHIEKEEAEKIATDIDNKIIEIFDKNEIES